MPSARLASSTVALVLALAACGTDIMEDPVPDDAATTDPDEERPTVYVGAGTSTPAGDLRVRVVAAGASGADLVVERGADSADVSVAVGEVAEVLGHRIEVVDADAVGATLVVMDPSGQPVGG